MNKDFEHTQPLPRVSPDMESQKTQLLNVGKVRELEPVEIPRRQQQTDNGGYGGAGNMQPGDNTGINGMNSINNMNSMNSINGRNGMNMNVPGNPPQKDRPGGRGKMIALLAVGFVVAAFCGAATIRLLRTGRSSTVLGMFTSTRAVSSRCWTMPGRWPGLPSPIKRLR